MLSHQTLQAAFDVPLQEVALHVREGVSVQQPAGYVSLPNRSAAYVCFQYVTH